MGSINSVIPASAISRNGLVAMKYKRKQRLIAKCGKRTHIFNMQANICMAWIPIDDVPCALALKGGCCGEKKPGVVTFANEADVRQWTNRGGR
jgi:hypothetical protein